MSVTDDNTLIPNWERTRANSRALCCGNWKASVTLVPYVCEWRSFIHNTATPSTEELGPSPCEGSAKLKAEMAMAERML